MQKKLVWIALYHTVVNWMKSMTLRINSITLYGLFLVLFGLNTFVLEWPILGSILLIFYLALFGNLLGNVLKKDAPFPDRWWIGLWSLLSLLLIVLTTTYYLAFIPKWIFQGIALVPPLFFCLHKYTQCFTYSTDQIDWRTGIKKIQMVSKHVWIAVACTLLSVSVYFHYTLLHPITDAVRSPFERVPVSLIVFVALSISLIFPLLYRGREHILSIALFVILCFSFFSFTAIVFPIGYGFDSFIHKATESHLAEFGTITPKPFYYIGQYVLVLFFSHAFSLPLELVDTFLVPVLAALLIPLAWYGASVCMIKNPRHALFPLVGLFLLPLDSFIVTTPQSLANLWIFLTILASVHALSIPETTKWFQNLIPIFLGTMSAILIHPIAGIPIFFYTNFLAIPPLTTKRLLRRLLFWILFLFGTIMLPASFLLNAIKTG
ncbi:MAG: hypothetical protein AAB664_02255, partial [Patescibacteria group bacterium]